MDRVGYGVSRAVVPPWRIATMQNLFPAKKHFANGVRRPLHRNLGINRPDKIGKGVVDTDDFLPLKHDQDNPTPLMQRSWQD